MSDKEILQHVKDYCKKGVEHIDLLSKNNIATNSDYAQSFIYRRILDIINESEG